MARAAALAVSIAVGLGLSGCGGSRAPEPLPSPPSLASRPFGLKVPAGYVASAAAPLVLVLHGYGSNGQEAAGYFRLIDGADQHGFLLAYPDGTVDVRGNRFWNATDYCCNFYNDTVDDVAYLTAVVDDVEARYAVDPKRVYVIGHSNGGFMAHRLACEVPSRFAAAVSLAGATYSDPRRCTPASVINVLQVHGDLDPTIAYRGTGAYPGAERTAAIWAEKNGCTGGLVGFGPDDDLDLDLYLPGAETRPASYAGCPQGGAVDLWTIRGGGHVPSFGPAWADAIWAYLDAHPKP